MSSRDEVIAEIQRVTGQAASDEQLKILQSTGGKCILASAGSGKTTVLTRSLAVDISTGAIDPRKLLCTTYSKAGATEMSIRTQQLLSSLGMHCKVDVRTMHSSYYKVLRDFGIVKKVVSPGQRSMFVREACKDARVRLEDDDLETVDSLLSYQVNNLMDDKTLFNSYVFTLENISLEQYAAIRLGYSKRKQDEGFIDFDDMQMYMYMLCVSQKNPDVLNYCHNMWEYFYVDEFQDISKIQFAILRALVTDPNKLVCVGDDDQCIYQWRGADPTIIQNICAYYDLNKFILSTNYRCAGEIVKRAAVGIENNVLRSEKGMVPFNEGGNIRIIDTKANLCAMSQKAIDYIEFLINNLGATPDDIAILSRNNAHLGILGNMLMKRRYFVEANEGTKISGQAAFRDIKNVILMAEGTTSAEVCKAVLWRCCSYLGAAGATTMSKFMRDTNCTIKQAIGYALCHCFNYPEISDGGLNVPVRVASKLDVSLRSVATQGIESLKKMYTVLDMPDVNERIKAAIAIYEESIAYMYKTADRSRCLSGMVEYMSGLIEEMGVQKLKSFIHLTEQTEQNQLMAPPGIGRITLSTMHGAKGREWKYVILMADDNICFPSFEGINTMLSRGVSESDVSNSVDENRRLHYVAMTRAKQELAIFAPVDDLSVFTLEALGILDSKNSSYNSHIISMAKNNVLPEWVRKEIDAKIKSEQSWYYYNEPWKSEADSDSDKPENSEVEAEADSDTPPWAEQDDGPEVTVSKASTSKPVGAGLMGRMGKPLTDFKSLAQSDPMEDELGDLFDGE